MLQRVFLSIFLIFSLVLVSIPNSQADDCWENDEGCKVKLDKQLKIPPKFLKRSFKGCFPISIPYNLPDGWNLAHIYYDENKEYTRIFNFKDITHQCRYAIKNNKDYNAWCLDQNLMGKPDYDYMARTFNPIGKLPDFGKFDTPKGEVTLEEFLKQDYNGNKIPFNKILYIINNRDGYSKAEVQEAIWYYTMGDGNFDAETTRYMELVNAAEEYGDGYIPPCNGKWFIFAITKAAEEIPDLPACKLSQPFIIEMPVPRWLCHRWHLLNKKYSKKNKKKKKSKKD